MYQGRLISNSLRLLQSILGRVLLVCLWLQHFICRYFEEKKLKGDVSEITGNVIEVTHEMFAN